MGTGSKPIVKTFRIETAGDTRATRMYTRLEFEDWGSRTMRDLSKFVASDGFHNHTDETNIPILSLSGLTREPMTSLYWKSCDHHCKHAHAYQVDGLGHSSSSGSMEGH